MSRPIVTVPPPSSLHSLVYADHDSSGRMSVAGDSEGRSVEDAEASSDSVLAPYTPSDQAPSSAIGAVAAARNKKILITTSPESNYTLVSISDQRVHSRSEGEGNHTIARVLFLELFANMVATGDIKEIPGKMERVISALFPEDRDSLHEIIAKHKRIIDGIADSSTRRDIDARLKGIMFRIPVVGPDDAQQDASIQRIYSAALRDGGVARDSEDAQALDAMIEIFKLARGLPLEAFEARSAFRVSADHAVRDMIQEVGSKLIHKLETVEYATLHPTVGGGRNEAHAINILQRLSEFIDLAKDHAHFMHPTEGGRKAMHERLKKYTEPRDEGAISTIFDHPSSGLVNLTARATRGGKNPGEGREILHRMMDAAGLSVPGRPVRSADTLVKNLSNCMGMLFDFPQNHPYFEENAIAPEDLYKVVARIVTLTFSAYPQLQTLDQDVKDRSVNDFLKNHVLQENKWNEFQITRSRKLNFDTLRTGVDAFLHRGEMRMKTDLERGVAAAAPAPSPAYATGVRAGPAATIARR